jgi:hypothetical protein
MTMTGEIKKLIDGYKVRLEEYKDQEKICLENGLPVEGLMVKSKIELLQTVIRDLERVWGIIWKIEL